MTFFETGNDTGVFTAEVGFTTSAREGRAEAILVRDFAVVDAIVPSPGSPVPWHTGTTWRDPSRIMRVFGAVAASGTRSA